VIARLLDATPYALAVNVPYGIAFAAIAIETSWLFAVSDARRTFARSTRTAVAMGMGGLVVSAVYTLMLRGLWLALSPGAPRALDALWRAHPVIGAVTAFVCWDAAGWVYHWVGHRTRIGWAAHRPHHTGDAYDMTLGLRQSWAPFHGLAYQPLLALAGFDFRVIAVCAAVSNCWQILEHTAAPITLPRWLSAVVMTPESHRHHHDVDAPAVNLGPVFTWWDRLAGSWVPLGRPAPARYGIPSAGGAVAIQLSGWRDLPSPALDERLRPIELGVVDS
jgi:sterol desaturase/sphingolipid hydroxylase (fatty acid hydroxylase superfamily)